MTTGKYKMTLETPSDLEIVLSRMFDAPRSLVFECFTEPHHVEKWWGPEDCATVVSCEADLRVGGAWKIVTKANDGSVHPFKGVYLEIVRPELVKNTMIYDVEPYNRPEFEATVTIVFEDLDGKTRIVETIKHQTKEGRDGHLGSGMDYGAAIAFDQLEALIEEQAR